MDESRQERLSILHKLAQDAFHEARAIFEQGPLPGSLAWDDWQRLFNKAIAANEEFLRVLRDDELAKE